MTIYVGRLTYWIDRSFAPSTFLCVSENKDELEKYAIEIWNEMMPHRKIETVEQLRDIDFLNPQTPNCSWDVWERVEGEIKMHYILEQKRRE